MDNSVMRQRAKNLRRQSTDTERHLWYYLRASRLGFKFKRQVPIGNYYAIRGRHLFFNSATMSEM